jgi:hypothetical protein
MTPSKTGQPGTCGSHNEIGIFFLYSVSYIKYLLPVIECKAGNKVNTLKELKIDDIMVRCCRMAYVIYTWSTLVFFSLPNMTKGRTLLFIGYLNKERSGSNSQGFHSPTTVLPEFFFIGELLLWSIDVVPIIPTFKDPECYC